MKPVDPKTLLAAAVYLGYNSLQIGRLFKEATPYERDVLVNDAIELGFEPENKGEENERRD